MSQESRPRYIYYLTQALDALKSDSQKGTFGKRGDKPKVDPAYLDQADKVHNFKNL